MSELNALLFMCTMSNLCHTFGLSFVLTPGDKEECHVSFFELFMLTTSLPWKWSHSATENSCTNETNRDERRKYSEQFPCHSKSNDRDQRLGLFSVVRFCSRAKSCVCCHVQYSEAFERKMQFSVFIVVEWCFVRQCLFYMFPYFDFVLCLAAIDNRFSCVFRFNSISLLMRSVQWENHFLDHACVFIVVVLADFCIPPKPWAYAVSRIVENFCLPNSVFIRATSEMTIEAKSLSKTLLK